jgi:hypothetical protein
MAFCECCKREALLSFYLLDHLCTFYDHQVPGNDTHHESANMVEGYTKSCDTKDHNELKYKLYYIKLRVVRQKIVSR